MASILNVNKIRATGSTTDGLVVNSSGQVTLPAIPFLRMKASGSSVAVSSGKGTVPFDNVIDSRGITLNTSTYLFQVPVTGLYHFSGSVRWDRAASYLWWSVEDSSGTTVQSSAIVLQNGNSGSFITSSGSLVIPLTAGTDYKVVFADGGNNTANIQAGQTFMTIYLVG